MYRVDVPDWRMPCASRSRNGFSLFELMLVVCVVGVAAVFFFDRILFYQEMAERTAVDITVMHLRNGVRYRTAELMLHQKDREIVDMEGKNAMRWIEYPPPGYIGELSHPQSDQIAPGSWYFDIDKGELVYLVRRGRHFVSATNDRKVLRYRVVASVKRSTLNPSVTLAEGMVLNSLEKYTWF